MDQNQKKRAIELAIEGFTRKQIRRELNISNFTLNKAEIDDPKFSDEFNRSILIGVDSLADDLISLEEQDVGRARLISENIRWFLSKKKPATYGDKLEVNVNKTISLGAALTEAKARTRDVTPPNDNPKELTCDNHNDISNNQTDKESVQTLTHRDKEDIYD